MPSCRWPPQGPSFITEAVREDSENPRGCQHTLITGKHPDNWQYRWMETSNPSEIFSTWWRLDMERLSSLCMSWDSIGLDKKLSLSHAKLALKPMLVYPWWYLMQHNLKEILTSLRFQAKKCVKMIICDVFAMLDKEWSGSHLIRKTLSYQYRDSHVKEKTVSRPSYL